jgi:hypothetical protein
MKELPRLSQSSELAVLKFAVNSAILPLGWPTPTDIGAAGPAINGGQCLT